MERTPVKSSSISSVGYDPKSQGLRVEFASGRTYEYAGVTPEEHDALVNSGSVGAHFTRHIRPHFEGRPV